MSTCGQRRAPRKAVTMCAMVSDRELSLAFTCQIRDASTSGCRITTPELASLPDKIYIWPEHTSGPIKGRIIWRRDQEAGVELLWHAPQLDAHPQEKGSPENPAKVVVVLDDL